MKWLEKEDLADDEGGDEDFQEVEEESPSVSASGPSSRSGPSTASASGGMKKKNIEDIKFGHPSSYLIAGLTKCGKTKWLRSFVFNNHDKYNRIYAFSSSAKFNQDYDFLEKSRIFDPSKEADIQTLVKIVKLQRSVRAKGIPYQLLLIFDDIVGVINTHGGKVGKFFDRLASSGRHIGISCVFITQRLTKISPTIRDNCLYWIVIKLKMNEIMDQVFSVQSQFTDKFRFWDYYLKITKERYSSLLIQNDNPYDPSCIPLSPVKEIKFHIKG